jgi:hypothetical protein
MIWNPKTAVPHGSDIKPAHHEALLIATGMYGCGCTAHAGQPKETQ